MSPRHKRRGVEGWGVCRRCSPRPDSGWQRADRNLLVSRVSQQHREQIGCSHRLGEHRRSSDTLWTGCCVIGSVLGEEGRLLPPALRGWFLSGLRVAGGQLAARCPSR